MWILWKWKLRRLGVEKWVLVIHVIFSLVFWYDGCHHNTDLRAGWGQKRLFSCSLPSHFHILVIFKWFLTFSSYTNRPDIIFQVLAHWIDSLHFWPYLSKQMFYFLRSFNFIDASNFMGGPFFIINCIKIVPDHGIRYFNSYMHTMGLIIKGIWKW